MQTIIVILGGFVIFSMVAILSPFIIYYNKEQYPIDVVKKGKIHSYASFFLITVLVFWMIGISFSYSQLNLSFILLGFVCFFALTLFSPKLKPKSLGLFTGIIATISFLIYIVFFGIELAFEDILPQRTDIGDSMYCESSMYGFVTSDSGRNVKVYKQYLFFIDVKIAEDRRSDLAENQDNHKPEPIIKRCFGNSN